MKAEVEFITLYEVVGYNDADWGGNSYVVFEAISRTREGALLLGKGKDSWGSDCKNVKERRGVVFNGDVFVLDGPFDVDGDLAKKKAEIKEQALNKLSQEEKEVLGLK